MLWRRGRQQTYGNNFNMKWFFSGNIVDDILILLVLLLIIQLLNSSCPRNMEQFGNGGK